MYYTELKTYISTKCNADNRDFLEFVLEKTQSAHFRDVVKIENHENVLHYLMCAYGCYVLSHNLRQKLIMNPQEILATKEEQDAFIELFIRYAKDEIARAEAFRHQRTSKTAE